MSTRSTSIRSSPRSSTCPCRPSISLSEAIGSSFERALEKMFIYSVEASVNLDRGMELSSLLHESTRRWYRRQATTHNSITWPLPSELTVKVFSMADTKSLVNASASCTMFKKYAVEQFCYSNVDLTTANVKSKVVPDMILKAGKELRSLKVGCPDESTTPLLKASCLAPLSYKKHGVLGNLLGSLHIYNHGGLNSKSLCGPLSVCSNLTDLKIVGLNFDTLADVVDSLTTKCQPLFLQRDNGAWNFINASLFQSNCPNLTSLSLIGFYIQDLEVYKLLMGLRKLKYMDLSKTTAFEGRFLRNVSHEFKDALIETLILRDSFLLSKRMVRRFLDSLLTAGRLRFIRHIDVSNDYGLCCGQGRCKKLKFPLEELKVKRPGLTFVAADFPTSSSSDSSSSESSSN
ncbi:unnamed protein product [Microthlaspi erraticum]|uniref:F-box domain-containing protein n=1 Tax=Microthlaspi erraticum TaxID=1685480 RepID=A0A6D2JUG8_9BRAS|nr:unnamed protein product [Microthlaspi erraticum]